MNKNTLIAVIGLAVILIGGLWFISSNRAGNDVVAVVNGQNITQEEFDVAQTRLTTVQGINLESLDEETRAQIRMQILDNLISQALLEQAAANADISVSDEEVQQQLAEIKAPFEDQETFEEAITQEGMTEEMVLEQIRSGLMVRAYLEQTLTLSAITADDAEITSTYNQAAESGEVPPLAEVREQVRASVIAQKQQQLIAEHLEELRADADIEIFV